MQKDSDTKKDFRKRVKPALTPQALIELGKLPPQAVDLEMAVLGAFMLDGDCLTNIIDILKPDVFYKEAHQRIFSAMEDLFNDAEPVDILTVSQKLKKKGELEIAGGAVYVTQLTNRIASSANCEFHARIVIEKFIQRELIRISTDTLQHSYEDTSDVFDLLHLAEENIFSISHTTIKKTYEHIRAVISKSLNEIESARNQEFNGVQSGFTALDRITGGWQKSDLIILAARPGAGKTAFAMTTARNAAVEFKKPVAIFSLEMPATQLVNRLISAEAEIDSDRLRKGDISENEWQKIHEKIGRLAEAPIFIDDTPALSVFEFRAKAKRLKRQHGIAAIFVDYLQLMTQGEEAKFGTREQEVAKISKVLKATAKELDIPIVALSQLSRSVEQRTDKRPQLSDLRESGSIEQEADVVMFIYRPFISGVTQDENGQSTEGMAEAIIAKHRNGRIDSADLMFVEQYAKFQDVSTSTSGFGNSAYGGSNQSKGEDFDENRIVEKMEPNRDFLKQGPSSPDQYDGNIDSDVPMVSHESKSPSSIVQYLLSHL